VKTNLRPLLSVVILFALSLHCSAAAPKAIKTQRVPQTPVYVIVNEDFAFPYPNEISIFTAGGTDTAPTLTLQSTVYTGGYGSYGGFFAAQRVNSVPDVAAKCLYVSNSGDNTISSVSLRCKW
jgi:hypothetical protein